METVLKKELTIIGVAWGFISWLVAVSSVSGRLGTVGAFKHPITILFTLPTYIPYNLISIVGGIIAAPHKLMEPVAMAVGMAIFLGTLIPVLPIISGVILLHLFAYFIALERKYLIKIFIVAITIIFLLWWAPWVTKEEAVSQAKGQFLKQYDNYSSINSYKTFGGYTVVISYFYLKHTYGGQIIDGRNVTVTHKYRINCLERICVTRGELTVYDLVCGCW